LGLRSKRPSQDQPAKKDKRLSSHIIRLKP
jgi:hypothetical protein